MFRWKLWRDLLPVKRRSTRPSRAVRPMRLRVEELEDRRLLSGAAVGFLAAGSSGSEGTTPAKLTVALSSVLSQAVSVNYAVTGGTATGGGVDFTLANGKLTFLPGQTSRTIALALTGDARDELDETIQLTLSNPVGADLGVNAVHTFTILDDDPPPKVSFALAGSSGSEGLATAHLVVTLSAASGKPVTVGYKPFGGTATGAGVDYLLAGGTLTFNPGQTRRTIPITIVDDARDENNETIQVTLFNPSNAVLGANAAHTYTIVDNDAMPVVAFESATSSGGEGVSPATVTVSLSAMSGRTVNVKYYTSAITADADVDYTAAAGQIVFAPGETSKTIALTILEDTLDENDETFGVALWGASGAVLGRAAHFRTIIDNDAPPTVAFSLAASTTTELMSAPVIMVTLSNPSAKTVTVSYAATGGSAAKGFDYLLAGKRFVFQPGQTAKKVPLQVINDRVDEPDETVVLTLSGPVNAGLGSVVQHTLTILDDEGPPSVSFRVETSSGLERLPAATLLVGLSRLSAKTVTVNYAPIGGTATEGVDYHLTPGTLTFNAGQLTRSIIIPLVNDGLDEPNETILVGLSNPVNADLGLKPVHTFTIIDDDAPPSISFSSRTSVIGEGSLVIDLIVTLSESSAKVVTVNHAVTGGTAKQSIDYLFAGGTLVFAPGETSKTLSFTIFNDNLIEAAETVRLSLFGAVNAILGLNPVHFLTIADDDPVAIL